MKFIIDGKEYEAGALDRVTGVDALELPRQAGLGLQTLARRLDEVSRLGYDEAGNVIVLDEGSTGDGSAVVDSEPHLRAMLAFIWLSRRIAGDHRLTFADACAFPFMTLDIITDEVPEVDETPDPTLAASVPAAVPVPADSLTSSTDSTTSTDTSPSTS